MEGAHCCTGHAHGKVWQASVGMQVYRTCPQALLPVLPHLEIELQADEDAKRLAAVGLVGRLFSVPGSDMDAQYAGLFGEFVRRFRDLKARLSTTCSCPGRARERDSMSVCHHGKRCCSAAAFELERVKEYVACAG